MEITSMRMLLINECMNLWMPGHMILLVASAYLYTIGLMPVFFQVFENKYRIASDSRSGTSKVEVLSKGRA